MSDFFELSLKRESCRNFDKEKRVEDSLIEKCLMTAMNSAFGM